MTVAKPSREIFQDQRFWKVTAHFMSGGHRNWFHRDDRDGAEERADRLICSPRVISVAVRPIAECEYVMATHPHA